MLLYIFLNEAFRRHFLDMVKPFGNISKIWRNKVRYLKTWISNYQEEERAKLFSLCKAPISKLSIKLSNYVFVNFISCRIFPQLYRQCKSLVLVWYKKLCFHRSLISYGAVNDLANFGGQSRLLSPTLKWVSALFAMSDIIGGRGHLSAVFRGFPNNNGHYFRVFQQYSFKWPKMFKRGTKRFSVFTVHPSLALM